MAFYSFHELPLHFMARVKPLLLQYSTSGALCLAVEYLEEIINS